MRREVLSSGRLLQKEADQLEEGVHDVVKVRWRSARRGNSILSTCSIRNAYSSASMAACSCRLSLTNGFDGSWLSGVSCPWVAANSCSRFVRVWLGSAASLVGNVNAAVVVPLVAGSAAGYRMLRSDVAVYLKVAKR